ncbi:hypothetical protein H2198_010776 [Neophaeococcomyces mojaviensis]|uniref:Uncharacterized protein n=1 Tax=Neophaeococcomyces mojaviensis TaxID=3383035 RepID=A0ACC2ZR81_9EURO|nr:hypothetical protein H2198_010776 [Knufia sp. JES_112]
MARKRSSTYVPAASKKQRTSAPIEVPKKASTLVNLPPEVLDQVLSYLVVIPWDPVDGLWGSGIERLFRRNVMQINRYIRKQAIDLMVRSTLWVHIVCQTRAAYKRLRWHLKRLPAVPSKYRSILPSELPGLHLEFGQPGNLRRTRSFTEDDTNLVFPFNFQSIAMIIGSLIGSSTDIQSLTIRQDHLSPQLERVITQQIHSLVPLLRHDLDVTITNSHANKIVYPRHKKQKMTSSFPRADDLMSIVLNLDTYDRKLEATLLCMHYNFVLFIVTDHDPYVGFDDEFEPLLTGPLVAWAGSTGALCQPGWQTDPNNLERMRRARTLHYLEYRACLGYMEGVREYGYDFVFCNYVEISNMPGINHGSPRWRRDIFNVFYGLPDFELAQLHHARALIYWHRHQYYEEMIHDGILEEDEGNNEEENMVAALMWAYYAWSLDMKNKIYSRFLRRLIEEADEFLVGEALEYMLTYHEANNADSFGGDPILLVEWCREGNTRQNISRAQQIARLADVAYDKRRGDELPKEHDPDERWHAQDRFLKPEDYDEACEGGECFCCKGGLKVELLNDNSEDEDPVGQSFSHVAPWSQWNL